MKSSKDYIRSERWHLGATLTLLLATTLSGLVPYVLNSHSHWSQWNVLLHILAGLGLSIALLVYLVVHFKRTIDFRRPFMLVSGLLTVPLLATFTASGVYLALEGQRENERWILNTHLISGFVFLGLLLIHVVAHGLLFPARRRAQSSKKYTILSLRILAAVLVINAGLQALAVGLDAVYRNTLSPYSTKPLATEAYLYNYGDHPFRPSQTETTSKAYFVDERQIANSHRCVGCHEDIARQWMASLHRQAASDPTYVTNVSLLAEKKGISATRYCEGCHAPVALLTGQLSPGGQHGGILNTPANNEGVSCMGCHGIQSLPHLKGVASYTFDPAEDYLFARSEHPLLSQLNALLIRSKPGQHRHDMGNPLLKDPKVCSACHTQFMDVDMNNWGWVKMQDEYGAWLDSPFSKQQNLDFSMDDTVRCHDCHMPLTASTDPSANDAGLIRSHLFPGANTMVAYLSENQQHLAAVTEFLKKNKMRVTIEEPNRQDAVQNLQALDESLRGFDEAPYYYYLGESANLNIIVSNVGVGHDFPGGTIDINQAWMAIRAVDAEGSVIYHSGDIDGNGFVDPDAYFYHSTAIDRNGKHVWRHDLFNMVGESFKRVIKSGMSDVVTANFTVPSWAKSPLTVTATLKYRKLNNRYAQWALKDKYTKDLPVVDVAWDALQIPLRIRREVETP